MRVVIKKSGWLRPPFRSLAWVGLSLLGFCFGRGASVLTFYYVRFSRVIDERLQGSVFPNVSQIYAAPEKLRVGEKASLPRVISYLRSAGLSERQDNPKGSFTSRCRMGFASFPGPDSYFARNPPKFASRGARSAALFP